MKIIEKLAAKEHDMYGKPPVTIAFLGDSVTHGCFEVYRVGENGLDTVFEAENSYSHKVKTPQAALHAWIGTSCRITPISPSSASDSTIPAAAATV